MIEQLEEEGGPFPVYIPKRGPKPNYVQEALVLRLIDEGLNAPEIFAHPDVTLGRTKVFELVRYNKKATPDSAAHSTPPDMERGIESPEFTCVGKNPRQETAPL